MSKVVVNSCVDAEGGPITGYTIFCPGCKCGHRYDVGRWLFNGDFERPTFTPSYLVQGGKDRPGFVCHSYVTDGVIVFLADCTHEFKGQALPLEPL